MEIESTGMVQCNDSWNFGKLNNRLSH